MGFFDKVFGNDASFLGFMDSIEEENQADSHDKHDNDEISLIIEIDEK